jgi:Carboxypeptidase regulatory-like domain/Putative Ig domain
MITPPHRADLGNCSTIGSSKLRGPGLLGLVILVAAVACGDANDPQPFGSLVGVARDAASQAPLEGVTVTVAGREGQTAGDGSYEIDSVPTGTHEVTAERAGYVSDAFDAEIRADIDNIYDVELTASEPIQLTVTTSSLPAATIGVAYEADLEAAGGAPPYLWSWSSNSPPGLILDASGRVTGTPAYPAGTHGVVVTVRDSENTSSVRTITIGFEDPTGLEVTGLQLETAEAGTPYADNLEATGGTGPYTFEWSAPTDIEGLTLEGSTGAISGTPVRPTGPAGEPVSVPVTVHDAAGASAIGSVTIGIAPRPLEIDSDDLPDGQVGVDYEGSLSAVGGFGQRTWVVVAGALPPGLAIQSESLFGPRITGEPTLAGSYTFTLRVQDDVDEATREFTVVIAE